MAVPINRRRSQRLLIQVPVIVEAQLAGNPTFSEKTQTLVVNAHGALVELKATLDPGQTVTLRNVRTNESEGAIVKLVTPGDPGKFNIALEFIKPNPGFWHINFPPDDWSGHHPDAKKD